MREQRAKDVNETAWINGIYMCHAIGSCLSKKAKYPSEPLEIVTKKEDTKELTKEEKTLQREKLIASLRIMKMNFDKANPDKVYKK